MKNIKYRLQSIIQYNCLLKDGRKQNRSFLLFKTHNTKAVIWIMQ